VANTLPSNGKDVILLSLQVTVMRYYLMYFKFSEPLHEPVTLFQRSLVCEAGLSSSQDCLIVSYVRESGGGGGEERGR
jgi:hypothetical protein